MVQSSRVNLLTWECEPLRADERFEKVFCLSLTHRLRSPPSPEGRGLCWMMDSATSSFDSAQNDRVVKYCEE